MRKLLLTVVITVICTCSFAQKKTVSNVNFSAGPELALATGDFNATHSVGIGATVQANFKIVPLTYVTITTGYVSYAGRSAGAGIKFKAAGVLPVKAGVKYFLSQGFYGAAQLGAGFFNNNTGTAFAYTPMLGYEFYTKSGKAVDAGFKYDGYVLKSNSLGSVGLRVAYRF